MGNCTVTVHVTGHHHNGHPGDVDQVAAKFVDELKTLGHNVTDARMTSGGTHDLTGAPLPIRSQYQPAKPAAPATPASPAPPSDPAPSA